MKFAEPQAGAGSAVGSASGRSLGAALRLAEGQVRPLLADQRLDPTGDASGPRSGEGEPGDAGDAGLDQDRHRRTQACP